MPTTSKPEHPLVDVLRSRNATLASQAERLIREAGRVLEYTVSTFLGGTDHTFRHTTTVEQIGRMFLPDGVVSELTDQELFFLTLACHFHDLAMSGTEADDRSPESREQARRAHAITVGTRITEKWAELGFEDQRTAGILAEVCRGHRPKKNAQGEAVWDELPRYGVLNPGVAVRIRLLSALIYAIDELHLGGDRAAARVQNWREIRGEEDRRHWKRHQAVNGPTLVGNASLLFQVEVETPGFEENLRSQVFRKALAAVRDLLRQASAEGITAPFPSVVVEWERKELWRLLLPIACSDLQPRPKVEVEQAILDLFTARTKGHTNLSEFCAEHGQTEEVLRQSVRRCVDDAVTCRDLIPATTPGTFVLSVEEAVAGRLFGRTRRADELDRLFQGRYCPCWEEQLFESAYGRAYVSNCVVPAVDRAYSVQLAGREVSDPVRSVLERCPSAARLALDFSPPPSHWVKDGLLRQAAITGALYDLHADPNRILQGELRAAVRSLIGQGEALAPLVRLIEEMALIGGFTMEQISAAQIPSDAAQRAIARDGPEGEDVRISITQSVPAGAPAAATQLPRLMLASQRAKVEVRLAHTPDHVVDVRVFQPTGELPERMAMIGIGPGEPNRRGAFYRPARLAVSQTERTVRFFLSDFSRSTHTPRPFVVRIPPPPRGGGEVAVTFSANADATPLRPGSAGDARGECYPLWPRRSARDPIRRRRPALGFGYPDRADATVPDKTLE